MKPAAQRQPPPSVAPAPQVDQIIAGDTWRFDAQVAARFDNMLSRSIPQYQVMRKAVRDLACRYIRLESDVLDLGCSRGEGLAPLLQLYGPSVRLVGVDHSKPMVRACRERFKKEIRAGHVLVQELDLTRRFPICRPSVVQSVLTLMFVPLEHRQQVVSQAYDRLAPGGALLLVEKVLGADAQMNTAMVELYLALKQENGYTPEQIEAKRLSLRGVLVPITAAWNEQILRSAGFTTVDCFWRWMNFAGWLAVKGA